MGPNFGNYPYSCRRQAAAKASIDSRIVVKELREESKDLRAMPEIPGPILGKFCWVVFVSFSIIDLRMGHIYIYIYIYTY